MTDKIKPDEPIRSNKAITRARQAKARKGRDRAIKEAIDNAKTPEEKQAIIDKIAQDKIDNIAKNERDAIEAKDKKKLLRAESVIVTALFKVVFPKVFDIYPPKPLAKGIRQEIYNHKDIEGFSYYAVRLAIADWVCRTPYKKSIINNKFRFDLNGDERGEVTKEEKIHEIEECKNVQRRNQIKRIKKLGKDKRKIEKSSEQQNIDQVQANKTNKLKQLVVNKAEPKKIARARKAANNAPVTKKAVINSVDNIGGEITLPSGSKPTVIIKKKRKILLNMP
jgi:sRNA-binding protein